MSDESWCMACGATVPALTRHSWDDCVRNHEKRIKTLEAQLGATDVGLSTDREAVVKLPISASSPPAAPSVSAETWVCSAETWAGLARSFRKNHYIDAPRACDLAAAVTRWYEDPKNDHSHLDYMKLERIVGAFCRGEKLPEVK